MATKFLVKGSEPTGVTEWYLKPNGSSITLCAKGTNGREWLVVSIAPGGGLWRYAGLADTLGVALDGSKIKVSE